MQMFKYLCNDNICCLLPHLHMLGPCQNANNTRLLKRKEDPEEKRVTLTSYVVKSLGSKLNRESENSREMTTFQLSG